jgi:hypothetical protein
MFTNEYWGHQDQSACALLCHGLDSGFNVVEATLKANGLIEEAHPAFDARVRIYTLRPEPMTRLKAWLEQTEQLWAAQLVAFKTHVDR